jgi:hypothetical protein
MARPKNIDGFACETCGKKHNSRQARYAHKKSCKGIKSLEQQIIDLKGKLQEHENNAATIAGITINNITNIFNINQFDVSALAHEMMCAK